MKLVILAAIAAIATPAAAADQFDLVCTGMNKDTSLASRKPIAKHYRVDLTSGRWCQDNCSATEPIASVAQDKIIFRSQAKQYARDTLIIEEVNRVNGEWTDVIFGAPPNGNYWNTSGKCEPAQFSGFPAVATKF